MKKKKDRTNRAMRCGGAAPQYALKSGDLEIQLWLSR